MRTIAAIALLAISAVPALAASPEARAPSCTSAADFRKEIQTKGTWEVLTPGQYRFVEGFYVGLPSTPAGMPPGDGAVIATIHGDKGGLLMFTSAKGTLVCLALPVPSALIDVITKVPTSGPVDTVTGQEM